MTKPIYRKTAPKPTAEQLAEIEKLEREADLALERREESWQRSDTDGFLSQWALGMTADLNRTKIKLLQNGGYSRFPVLVDANGNVVATKVYVFDNTFAGYGTIEKWRLPDELAAQAGRKWVPVAGWRNNSRIQKQLGLREEDRWFPAYAKITGSGTGLSGCATAYVGVFKLEEVR